jgi:hypothetical protein
MWTGMRCKMVELSVWHQHGPKCVKTNQSYSQVATHLLEIDEDEIRVELSLVGNGAGGAHLSIALKENFKTAHELVLVELQLKPGLLSMRK